MEKIKTFYNKILKLIPGFVLVAFLMLFAISIKESSIAKLLHLSPIIIAILLGMFVKNFMGVRRHMFDGVKFCSKKVLRFAIILLGFNLSLTEVAKLGMDGILVIGFIVVATMSFAFWFGRKLSLSKNLALLIAAGCSICGAAAVIAVSALKDKEQEEDVSFAIGVVTIFGTIVMLLYPFLYSICHMDSSIYAFWAGASIHEVAQVVAAGFAVSNDVGVMASLVKLTRVLYIIPVTLVLSLIYSSRSTNKFSVKNINIPWFVIFFLCVIVINSVLNISPEIITFFSKTCTYLMTAAMVALGLETNFNSMKKVGLKPVYVGIVVSIFISLIAFAVANILY